MEGLELETLSSTTTAKAVVASHWTISGQKWTIIGLLMLTSVVFGMFPYILFCYYKRVIRSDSVFYQIIMKILSSISGGVLFSTVMLHILPEVREKVSGQNEFMRNLLGGLSKSQTHAPIAEMLMLYGFCLIYIIEEITHLFAKFNILCSKANEDDDNKRSPHSYRGYDATKLDLDPPPDTKLIHLSRRDNSEVGTMDEKYATGQTEGQNDCCDYETVEDGPSSGGSRSWNDDNDSDRNINLPSRIRASLHSLHHLETESGIGLFRSLLSLLALSFHAVMEGIAVGVQDDVDLWMTFGAIASHKSIISLCLGMEMVKAQMKLVPLASSILFFSIVSPIGILIGGFMVSGDVTQSGWVVVIEGLAAGTLLYIIFFEILQPHHHDRDVHSSRSFDEGMTVSESDRNSARLFSFQGILQCLGTCLGIILASYLISMTSHEHEHNSNHAHSPCEILDVHDSHESE